MSTFEKAKLANAIFLFCDGSESNFDGADLTGATFAFARLSNTTWRKIRGHKIIFDKGRLDDAEIEQAKFYDTNLRGTSFNKTNLKFTDWRTADLLGADFRYADLRSSNVTSNQLRQTFTYEKAKLPNGTDTEF